jgi:transcriptional regulator with XRE-family HTH domain
MMWERNTSECALSIRLGIAMDEKMDGMHPGRTIANLLRQKGWSEGELSRRSRVPQPTIHRIITGESQEPKRSTLEKIARGLGVAYEDLFLAAPDELSEKAAEFAMLADSLTEDQVELLLRLIAEFRKKS